MILVVFRRLLGPADRTVLLEGTRWWSLAELAAVTTRPTDLALVIQGYWEGWLPDGPLSVDWEELSP